MTAPQAMNPSPRALSTLDAVVFDIGRVLVSFDVRRAIANLARAADCAVEHAERALFGGDRYRLFARGRVDGAGYQASFEAALTEATARPTTLDADTFRRAWCDMFWPLPGGPELLRDVAEHVPVYLCSNTDPLHFEHLFEALPELGLARGRALSYEVGAEKPDPVIFHVLTQRFGVSPERTLFVDDRADNVEGARALGFHAWLFTEPAPLRQALSEAGLLSRAGVTLDRSQDL